MLSIGSKIRLTITYGVCIRRMLAGRRSVINEATYQHLSKVSKEDTTLYSLLFKKKRKEEEKTYLKNITSKNFTLFGCMQKPNFALFGCMQKTKFHCALGSLTNKFHSIWVSRQQNFTQAYQASCWPSSVHFNRQRSSSSKLSEI